MNLSTIFSPTYDPLPRVLNTARLTALHQTELLDTQAEASFDRITALATRILLAPIAIMSLVDGDRQFFKSAVGLPPPLSVCRQSPLSHSFCQYVVSSGKTLHVSDAAQDPTFCTNGATTDWKVAAYLGVPLRIAPNDGDGSQVIGAFAVIDVVPRIWSDNEISLLEDLAALMETEMRLRASAKESEKQACALGLALKAQQQSEARFQGVTEACPMGVFVTDGKGLCTYANPKLVEITGSAAGSDLLGNGFLRTLHPEDRHRVLGRWKAALHEGIDFASVHRLMARDCMEDDIWISVKAAPLRGEQNQGGTHWGWAGSVEDITPAKKHEERLLGLTQELQRSNTSLQEFASVASHDLQEPLRKVQTFGDRLKTRYGAALDADGRDYLDRMLAASARMQTLIDDLLLYSRVSSKAQTFRPIDLNEIARGVVGDLEGRLEQTGGVVHMGNLPCIAADPVQMRQLMQNLIGNALKFHKPGVAPSVRVTAASVSSPEGDKIREESGAFCRILIQDNGIGFDAQYAERVFDVFERLHNRAQYEGTGMGLAICRKIVQRHGGTIFAHSVPNEGTQFVITLPLSQPKNPAISPNKPSGFFHSVERECAS